MRVFCFGFGQSARAAADLWLAKNITVSASFRNPASAKAKSAAKMGIEPVAFAEAGEALAKADILLVSIAPAKTDPVLAYWQNEIIAARPKQIFYLSSSAVYGDRQGSAVSEFDYPAGFRLLGDETASQRLRAEQAWQALAKNNRLGLTIFRLAAIYGAEQNPLRRLLRQRGVRVYQRGQLFSRIHTSDLARLLDAALQAPAPPQPEIFNVCDDEPAPQSEVIRHAARLLGLPTPPLLPLPRAGLSPMAARFYRRRKKLLNRRVKERFSLVWHYPTYREGLAACYSALAKSPAMRVKISRRAASPEKR